VKVERVDDQARAHVVAGQDAFLAVAEPAFGHGQVALLEADPAPL
jgi:hypothetical protein